MIVRRRRNLHISIFQVNEFGTSGRYACSNCWLKVETFHDFYVMVEANHQKGLINEIDKKNSVHSPFDCGAPIYEQNTSVKIESDRIDACASNYETVYVPSTPYWDDLEKSALDHHELLDSNPFSATNQDPVLFDEKETDESNEKKAQVSNSKTLKNTSRTLKSTSKTKKRRIFKKAIKVIDGFV